MLDKSVPHHGFHMLMSAADLESLPANVLPEKYSFRLFSPGDERHWARIETSVGEFESEEAALEYFRAVFLSHADEPSRRTVFVLDPNGVPVATASAWFAWDGAGNRLGALHWVAAVPTSQGLGLGKAATLRALSLFPGLEPDRDVVLHTQTWSHVAVRLYHRLGFRLVEDDRFSFEKLREGAVVRVLSTGNHRAALEALEGTVEPALLSELKARIWPAAPAPGG